MSKTDNGASAEGRVPPPTKMRFRKGRSGNPRGRPKGAVSLERLTRDFALKTQTVSVSGKPERMNRLQIAILKLKALAATGQPGAVALLDQLRGTITAKEPEHNGGFLVVPATAASVEEFVAEMVERDKDKVEPGTEVNVESEEYLKAVRGEPSPLGEAMRAFERKYSGR
ncbi:MULTISPECIES: DUF5681 domain-containing protein [Bradyrhizobium]|uniref:DUF5681 domain-containing protein n=1 Tax=Bradyrhizobium TaxID=374 RepID=UPI00040AD7EB|nr:MULTISPECIES: DUF5681 domain-containing protein [Bradyrhizobium]RZN30337.1 hypothetical protein CWO90_21010 [Bradyrhizobium sp. Leo121]